MTIQEYIVLLNIHYYGPNTYVITSGKVRVNAYGIIVIEDDKIILKKGSIIRSFSDFCNTSSTSNKSSIDRRSQISTQTRKINGKEYEIVDADFECSSKSDAVKNVALVSTAHNYIFKLSEARYKYTNISNKRVYANYNDVVIAINNDDSAEIIQCYNDSLIGKTVSDLCELYKKYDICVKPSEWTGSFDSDGDMKDFRLDEVIKIESTNKLELISDDSEKIEIETEWDSNERKANTIIPEEHYNKQCEAMKRALEDVISEQFNDGITVKIKETEDSKRTTLEDYRSQVATVIDIKKFERFTFNTKLKDKLLRTAKRDKAILLTGTPGGGKTTWAKYLAYKLTDGAVTSDRIEVVQFSPSTGYSNFMEGLSANDKGFFEIMKSTCLRLCDRAINDRDNTYVLVLDEINRCRVTDVLGELLNMIEARGEYIRTNNGLLVTMPDNIIIIATMNTFDSGASDLPYALRTRFAEYEITGQDVDIRKLIGNDVDKNILDKAEKIWEITKSINEFIFEIKKTSAYGIGPRPFGSKISTIKDLQDIVESRILKDIKIVLKMAYENNTISEEIEALELFVETGELSLEDTDSE